MITWTFSCRRALLTATALLKLLGMAAATLFIVLDQRRWRAHAPYARARMHTLMHTRMHMHTHMHTHMNAHSHTHCTLPRAVNRV